MISIQVITEFASVLKDKFKVKDKFVIRDFERLFALNPKELNREVIEAGLIIYTQYKLSFCDSLILGAAQVTNYSHLYSEDL